MKDVPDNQPFTIATTVSHLGEGFDEPRLDTLVLAAPAAWDGVITQYSGRLHREHEGKSKVVVYDYIDASVPMLDHMHKKRLRSYKKLSFEIVPFDSEDMSTGRIVGTEEYLPMLSYDLEIASKSVFLSTPYLSQQRLKHVKPAL